MADSIERIKSKFPIPVFYYDVKIDQLDPIAFSEVSGLAIEYDTISYSDGLSWKEGSKKMPGLGKAVNLTLKKGITRGDSKLFSWINSIKLNTVQKKDLTVTLKDEGDQPVVTWKVINAFPTKLDAPSFNASSNEVAIESLSLLANKMTIEYH